MCMHYRSTTSKTVFVYFCDYFLLSKIDAPRKIYQLALMLIPQIWYAVHTDVINILCCHADAINMLGCS